MSYKKVGHVLHAAEDPGHVARDGRARGGSNQSSAPQDSSPCSAAEQQGVQGDRGPSGRGGRCFLTCPSGHQFPAIGSAAPAVGDGLARNADSAAGRDGVSTMHASQKATASTTRVSRAVFTWQQRSRFSRERIGVVTTSGASPGPRGKYRGRAAFFRENRPSSTASASTGAGFPPHRRFFAWRIGHIRQGRPRCPRLVR